MNELLKLAGLLNESTSTPNMETFASKRFAGAEKITDNAKAKGGPALLTYHHFEVKLPYYKKAEDGKFNHDKFKQEYTKLCNKLHKHMNKIESMDQIEFQKLVGKLEVIGELLIYHNKKS